MKHVEKKESNTNFTSVTVGEMSQLKQHLLQLSPEIAIPGKVFVGNALQATGVEISFQTFAPGSETGFLHNHKTHEEVYIFIKGRGEFQVDQNIFTIEEGSIVRVSPNGKRSVRNHSNEELIMICIQYKANTFNNTDAQDGIILSEPVNW